MGVGAAKTEGVDAGHQRLARRGYQRLMAGDDIELQRREADVRVERAHVQRGRYSAIFQHQHRLDEAGHARRRLKVAEVGLDRTDGQQLTRRTAFPIDRADGRCLDGVAH